MKIPPFLLDSWLNQSHFAAKPPDYDFASSTGPHRTSGELFGLISAEEQALLLEAELVYSNAAGSEKLRQAVGAGQTRAG
jgi:hypothetical protein